MTNPFDFVSQPKAINFQYELALLSEECGEVVQIAGKVLRFGWDSSPPKSKATNLDLFHCEIGDVLAAAEFAVERGLLNPQTIIDRKNAKLGILRNLSTSAPQTLDRSPATNPSLAKSHSGALTKKQERIGFAITVALSITLVMACGVTLILQRPPQPLTQKTEASAQVDTNASPGASVVSQSSIESAAKECLRKSKAMGSTGVECDAIVALTKEAS